MVRYGGYISDNEHEAAEASAVKGGASNLKKPSKGLYASVFNIYHLPLAYSHTNVQPSVQIQNNPAKTMKEKRGGDDKWQDKHLPTDAKGPFRDEVVPRIRQLLGSLEPWTVLTPGHVQASLDNVFGHGTHTAAKDEVFFNLVRQFL